MNFIDTDEKLIDFCRILETKDFITVDSEFLRERSYYPRLCLLQIGYDGGSAIVDPLSNVDLTPFFNILQNKNIVKVFHAGRQDVEIFYNFTGKIPENIFDTQIAAMVCGFGENVSYGTLVKEITSVDLDKSCRLTDWSIRPLDEDQLEYAPHDVTYLVDCYKHLQKQMEKNNRLDWIKDEMKDFYDEKWYRINPEDAWHRVRHNIHSQQFLSALKYLAEWREIRAQKFNTPRQSIIKDEVMLNLASARPTSQNELKQVRNLRSDVINGKLGAEILEALNKAKNNPLSDEECKADRNNDINVGANTQSLLEMLRFLLKLQCLDNGVVCRLVASEDDLRYFVRGEYDEVSFMNGWRYDLFGQYAQKLAKGELSISYDDIGKRIKIAG